MLLISRFRQYSNGTLLKGAHKLRERSARRAAIACTFLTEAKSQKLSDSPTGQPIRDIAKFDQFKEDTHETALENQGTKALVVRWYSR